MYLPEIPPDAHPAEALAVALGSVVILSALWGTGPVASICTLWFALTAYAWWAPRTAARCLRFVVVALLLLMLLGVRLADLPVRLVARLRAHARAFLARAAIQPRRASRRRTLRGGGDVDGLDRPSIRRLPTYDLD